MDHEVLANLKSYAWWEAKVSSGFHWRPLASFLREQLYRAFKELYQNRLSLAMFDSVADDIDGTVPWRRIPTVSLVGFRIG